MQTSQYTTMHYAQALLAFTLLFSACSNSSSDDDSDTADSAGMMGGTSDIVVGGSMSAGGTESAGEESGGTTIIDTPAGESMNGGEDSAGESMNGGVEAPTGMCDINEVTVAAEQATGDGGNLSYTLRTSTDSPYNVIQIQSLSDWNGPTSPGVYSLDGINYADCGLCLLAYTGCTDEGCDKTLYAQEGEVEFTAIGLATGDQVTAQLRNVVFREVTINEETFQSTEVPNGQTWCVNDLPIDQELIDPQASNCEQPNINCVGDAVPDYQLLSCATGELTSAHSLMDQEGKGLWMVLTAGWCPACRDYIPQVRENEPSLTGDGVNLVYVLGEDSSYGEPDLDYCRQYAATYGDGALERFYIDYTSDGGFYNTFLSLWPYLGPNGEFALPWNALVRSGMYNYEYVHGDGASTTLNMGINSLINP